VLIADADAFARQAMERTLGEAFDVIACADGNAALERACQQPPDLIILDLLLPGLDGLQLLRRLKADPRTAKVPVLVFSTLMAEDQARAVGADAFLAKPLRRSTFLDTVRRLLGESETPSETREEGS
jgi:CheY-like chemotaxis protein